jgi:hypothetical protein
VQKPDVDSDPGVLSLQHLSRELTHSEHGTGGATVTASAIQQRKIIATGRKPQPPIQWVPGAPSLRVKRPGLEAEHSPPNSAGAIPLFPNTPSWRSAQLKNAQGQLYLYCTHTIRGCIQKFPDWPPGARTANGTALCH